MAVLTEVNIFFLFAFGVCVCVMRASILALLDSRFWTQSWTAKHRRKRGP